MCYKAIERSLITGETIYYPNKSIMNINLISRIMDIIIIELILYTSIKRKSVIFIKSSPGLRGG